jgi:V8-like Glu-specific endopeptidase
MPKLYREITELIGDNKIEAVFSLLGKSLPADLYAQLVSFKNRWARNERDNRLGIISNADYSVERNKIVSALLELAREADEKEEDLPIRHPLGEGVEKVPLEDSAELEKIIGKSTFTKVDWLAKMVDATKSVCRIVVSMPNGVVSHGTGFLVAGGYVFTNYHVLGRAEEARYASLEFNYRSPTSKVSVYQLIPNTWIGDPELDFARVKVQDVPDNPLEQWGHLTLETDIEVQINDAVPIIQHPLGGVQQVSFRENYIKRISEDRKFIFYTTDTEKGSSGSPVFNADWKVVGLHHQALKFEELNKGTLFTSIQEYLQTLYRSNPPAVIIV